jgi:oxygen-independent coproporphyrinogen-3 oxidase
VSVPPTGLYIHWPYCDRICPYCDFNVARNRDVDLDRWTEVLEADLRAAASACGNRRLESIYFGGGTPSLMPPQLVARVIETADRLMPLRPGAEITLEANPTSSEAAHFAALAAAGVNRLSLGVQSFDDEQLSFLKRNHSGDEARLALGTALGLFGAVTADLIYALPGETAAGWQERLGDMIGRGVGHLSLYQLTVEPGTAFGRQVAKGRWQPLSGDQEAELYAVTQSETMAAGLPAYEISNHARPGAEAVHNALYWHGGDWIGIGPGAHGRLTLEGRRWASVGLPTIGSFLKTEGARYEWEALSEDEALVEHVAGALRTARGLDRAALSTPGGRALLERAHVLAEDGLITLNDERLRIPKAAWPVADRIIGELVAAL